MRNRLSFATFVIYAVLFPNVPLWAQPASAGPEGSRPEAEAEGRRYVEFIVRPWVARITGSALARDEGTPSATAGSVSFGRDLGVSGPGILLEAGLILHLTDRDAMVGEVLLGGTLLGGFQGSTRLERPIAFDDASFAAGDRARSDVELSTLAIGYRRAIWTGSPLGATARIEGGIGVRALASITDIRGPSAKESEDVVAVVPYLEVGGQLTVAPRLTLRAELQGGPRGIEGLFTEAADGSFFSLKALAEFRLTRYLSLETGLLYLRPHLNFKGRERDGNRAENRTDAEVLGGTVGLRFRF